MVETKTANSLSIKDTHISATTECIPIEKFPGFTPSHKSSTQKSRSLTGAEIIADLARDEDLATVVERLKNEEPPPSIEQARERRASIKKQRSDSIKMIRNRTASRASTGNRPSLEGVSKND